jgi:hypothetical protein
MTAHALFARRRALGLALTGLSLAMAACAPDHHPPDKVRTNLQSIAPDTAAQLDDAIHLYNRGRLGQLIIATDELERLENLASEGQLPAMIEAGAGDQIFNGGDETFEAEMDRLMGIGQGAPRGDAPLPPRPRRLHRGELGGLDAGSCRGCHFAGGADGAGTMTQQGFFRADGETLSSATVRDAPHVMGLGYIDLLAREIEGQLQLFRGFVLQDAASIGQRVEYPLRAQGLDFGVIAAEPDGQGGATLDTSGVRHVSPDLVIRPFGHKGRHASLAALVDEAIQAHHGLQSTSRAQTFADDPQTWLGPGEPGDYDDDGYFDEASSNQAMLLAAYMSMLGTPAMRAPTDPAMALRWSRGWRRFQDIGCHDCHRADLRFSRYEVTIAAQGGFGDVITLDLQQVGLEPRPRNLDFTPSPDGTIPSGAPLAAFTDLRRHDMGAALADDADEALPDGQDTVPARVWLTRSLWGLADTAPYLHDGRAPTVHDAILWHGGDAQEARDAYAALDPVAQGELRVFLMSLTRPPNLLVE